MSQKYCESFMWKLELYREPRARLSMNLDRLKTINKLRTS